MSLFRIIILILYIEYLNFSLSQKNSFRWKEKYLIFFWPHLGISLKKGIS